MVRTYTDGTVEHLIESCNICRSRSTGGCGHSIFVAAKDEDVRHSLKRSLNQNAGVWQRLADL